MPVTGLARLMGEPDGSALVTKAGGTTTVTGRESTAAWNTITVGTAAAIGIIVTIATDRVSGVTQPGPGPAGALSGRGPRTHFLLDAGRRRVLGDGEVILRLQFHPHLGGGPKVTRQAQRCVARNAPLSFDDSPDSVGRHSQGESQRVRRQSSFAQYFLKHLAGMKRL